MSEILVAGCQPLVIDSCGTSYSTIGSTENLGECDISEEKEIGRDFFRGIDLLMPNNVSRFCK